MCNIKLSKDQIPTKGDSVVKTIVNKDRTLCKLVFETGKHITFSIDPKSFVANSVHNSPVKKEGLLISAQPQQTSVNSMDKNTPNDQDYRNKAAAALARITGQPIEEVLSAVPPSSMPQTVVMDSAAADNQERLQNLAEEASRRSQERSTRLAEQLSASAGGKLERGFAGKQSISLG